MPLNSSAGKAQHRRLRHRLRDSFTEFVHLEAFSGILLVVAILIALIWANSPFAESYFKLWQTEVAFAFGTFKLDKTLIHWINDGLMAVFFLVVGLEIKRELIVGDLSTARKASLPIAAALGGMIVPAVIYAAMNVGTPQIRGWGVPMATDIAFSLGVLALLGSKAPVSLKLFLTALAIVDDIGAVLVIAIFYADSLSPMWLGWGLGLVALLVVLNRFGLRSPFVYGVIGFFVWCCFMKSGVHATIAGVLVAFCVPARVRINPNEFRKQIDEDLAEFRRTPSDIEEVQLSEERQDIVRSIERSCEEVQMPVERIQHILHPWNTFLIVPLFALANSGIVLRPELMGGLGGGVPLGIVLGLSLGKPIGIVLFSWLAVKMKLGELPRRVSWRQIAGVGCVAGIGFTMSLFISELAFQAPIDHDLAKLAILIASVLSAAIGFWALSANSRKAHI